MYRSIKLPLFPDLENLKYSTEFSCDLTEEGSRKDLSHVILTRKGVPTLLLKDNY